MHECGQCRLLPVQHRIRADALAGLQQTRGGGGEVWMSATGSGREVREGEVNEPLDGGCSRGVLGQPAVTPPPPTCGCGFSPAVCTPLGSTWAREPHT